MDQLVNIASNIHGGVLTGILVLLVVVDTSLALKTRLPKGLFLSKRLLMGSGYNLLISSIPLFCDLLIKFGHVNDSDELTIRFAMIVAFVAILAGVTGSCVTNYVIAYPNAGHVVKIVEKFLPRELQQKLSVLEGEDNDDNNNTI